MGLIQNQQAQMQPEQQQALQRVIIAATKIIHAPQVSQQLVQMMKSVKDPATALAQATLTIMKQLIEKSGKTIPEQVLVPAGFQVVQLLAELAQAAGLFQVTPELIKQAQHRAIQLFLKSVDPQLVQQVVGKMGLSAPQGAAPQQQPAAQPAQQPAAQPAGV